MVSFEASSIVSGESRAAASIGPAECQSCTWAALLSINKYISTLPQSTPVGGRLKRRLAVGGARGLIQGVARAFLPLARHDNGAIDCEVFLCSTTEPMSKRFLC